MPKSITFTDAQARAIRTRYEQLVPIEKLRKEFGYSHPILRNAILQAGGTIRHRGPVRDRRAKIPVFKNKLKVLEGLLNESINEEVLKTLVDYTLGFNDGRTFRKIDRHYGYDGTLSQFRKDHLEASYYVMGRLWRAVYRSVTFARVNLANYNVAEEDVKICLGAITPADRKAIRRWVKNTEYVHLPNEEGVHAVVKACEKTMVTIVNSKLRFIHQYDPCYEKEDLISFLRIVAYRVALKYDWEMLDGEFAFDKCMNYTKRSMWNAALLLIKQNTSPDYQRLVKVDTDQRLYQITTISMDAPADDEWLNIQKRLGEPEDRSLEILDLTNSLGQSDPKFFEYLRLEIEEVPAFSEFLMKKTGREENALYVEDYKQWRELALRFSGISKATQRKAMKRHVLREMGMWDRSKRRKPRTRSSK